MSGFCKDAISHYFKSTPSKFYFFDEIDSTNEELKRRSFDGAPHGTLAVANRQTAGKGRMGRSFYSPADTGIYMSILLRPEVEFSEGLLITSAASVAVCRAIEKVTDVSCEIKWVNDICINGKKICGILAEAVMSAGDKIPESIVLGIGINVNTADFPEEVRSRAGALVEGDRTTLDTDSLRSAVAAGVYDEVTDIYKDMLSRRFIEEYRRRSNVIGKQIRYGSGNSFQTGTAIDIDNNGGLIVRTEEGSTITLSTGEISVREV